MNVLDGSPSGLQEDAAVARSNSSVERGGVSPQEKRDVSTTTYNEEPGRKRSIGAQTWLSLVGGFVVIFFIAAAAASTAAATAPDTTGAATLGVNDAFSHS